MGREIKNAISERLSSSSSFYDELIEEEKSDRIDGIVIGKVAGFSNEGSVLVDFPGYEFDGPVPARSTVVTGEKEVGRDVALLFEGGDPQKPIVMGLIQTPEKGFIEKEAGMREISKEPIDLTVDGERITFTAKKEIVLRCGKASITLTRAGKILIRGAYLLNRSSGVNRIKGGSVQIN